MLVCRLSWRDSKTVRSTSSGTIRTNCLNSELVWLEHPDRFCGMLGKQSTVNQIVALLKARFGSENEAEWFRAELRNQKRKDESL